MTAHPTLTEQLIEQKAKAAKAIPQAGLAVMDQATAALDASGLAGKALKEGDEVPNFSLPNANGERFSLHEYTNQGPVVISFYRGGWCPYCNLELAALQAALPDIEAAGGRLIAISPNTPDNSLSTREKHNLQFEVLSDVGFNVIDRFGLAFDMPEELVNLYGEFAINVAQWNGEERWRLPIPATYVIDSQRKVVKSYVNADYRERLDPVDIITALKEIPAPAQT